MRIDFNFEPLTEQELRDAPRPEPEEIKEPIVPVPADAPPLAFKHPEFGVPVKLWPYLDAQSNLVGYMGRFNDEDGNKYYYPLTYCRMGHETAWRAHGFPAPYPLYNLPDLVSCPDKQVLIVRGEANVDAAKLLFQWRVMVDGSPGVRRTCEDRIVRLTATSARGALKAAKRLGRSERFSYKNSDGNPVHFDFVGVMELLRLDPYHPEEVWCDNTDRVRPMERRAVLIPPRVSIVWHQKP